MDPEEVELLRFCGSRQSIGVSCLVGRPACCCEGAWGSSSCGCWRAGGEWVCCRDGWKGMSWDRVVDGRPGECVLSVCRAMQAAGPSQQVSRPEE